MPEVVNLRQKLSLFSDPWSPKLVGELNTPEGFGVIVHLPLLSIGRPGEELPFNVRISDNDLTYHTQWRQWSHDAARSVIVLPARF